jgi:predicted TIM-barrel fold metal-dependent hydrolase
MTPGCACCAAPSRRRFLTATTAALGAAALGPATLLPRVAQAAAASGAFIDFHHHLEPSGKNVEGRPWSLQAAIEELAANSVIAMGWTGPVFDADPAAAAKKARQYNEWGAQIRRDHPERFGQFASLPMMDVDASLAEIAHAFDVLKVDGIGLATNYGEAWLGERRFQPIFEELNRRKAVVYVHPAQAPCCTASAFSYQRENEFLSAPWIEFPTNTARTILSLWASQTTQRLPDIRFVFSHGGGVMPILLGRFAGFSGWETVGPERLKALFPQGVYAEFGKLYFECAQAYAPETMAMLRSIVPASHLLFGSDYSYFHVAHSVQRFNALALPADVQQQIKNGNAAALLPRRHNG